MARLVVFRLTLFVTMLDLGRLSTKDSEEDSFQHGGYFACFLNQRLSLPHITSVPAADVMGCIKSCVENERCYSFNLAIKPDTGGNLLCQLLDTNQYSSPENFKQSKEFHFYSRIAAGPCLRSSCNQGVCRSVSERNIFVCECPTGFSGTFCEACDVKSGWLQHQNRCYKFFPGNKTWDQAEKNCEDLGASLLTIHSADENDFVKETWLVSAGLKAFIGLRDFQNTNKFTWADNSTVDFLNWRAGEPNYSYEDCAHMYENGEWNNVDCSHLLPYICEK